MKSASDGPDVDPAPQRQTSRPPLARLSLSRMGLLATVALLSACATTPAPTPVAATPACGVETIRELRHAGPPGKSPPMFVERQVQAC